MRRGLAAAAAVACACGAYLVWNAVRQPRPEAAAPAAGFDSFGRLASYAGKEETPCPPQQPRTAVILAIGQSNVANFGAARFASSHGARAVNFFDGTCWVARSPLYGADHTLGEPLTPLADRLIETGAADRVVLAVAAIGGRPIAHFARGPLVPMLAATIGALAARYAPTAIIWHQGESDLALGTSSEDYQRDFALVAARLRAAWPKAPIYVSVATKCMPIAPDWRADNAIARAQRGLADPAQGIFTGVDTDALLADADRYDACHMAKTGQEKFAEAYAAMISATSGSGR